MDWKVMHKISPGGEYAPRVPNVYNISSAPGYDEKKLQNYHILLIIVSYFCPSLCLCSDGVHRLPGRSELGAGSWDQDQEEEVQRRFSC